MNSFFRCSVAFLLTASMAMAGDWTQIKQTKSGYQIGTSTNQAVGFFNATPVVQPSGAAQVALTNTFSTVAIAPVKATNTSVQAALALTKATNTSAQAALTVGTSTDVLTNVTISLTTADIKYLDEGSVPRTNTVVTGATLTLAAITGVTSVTINTVHGYTTAVPSVVMTDATINTVHGYTTAVPSVVMTDATVSGPYGFASGTIGSNTISYINAIRAALVNLGLIKGSP